MTERKAFLDTWKFFAIAALPGFLSNFWVIFRSPNFLTTQDFIEWAVLTSSVVLLCCLSQLGIKPGYMQEVTDKGVNNRYLALTSSICVLSITGLLAGVFLVCLFKVLNHYQLWINTNMLFSLPIFCLTTNLYVIFQTDMRIRQKAQELAKLSIIQTMLSLIIFEAMLATGFDFLLSVFLSSGISNGIVCILLAFSIRMPITWKTDLIFLKKALKIGSFFLFSLLCRYASDSIVFSSFKWIPSETIGGYLGVSIKLCEPISILYVSAIQMAWGSHVYSWIKNSIHDLPNLSTWVFRILLYGFLLGNAVAILMWLFLFRNLPFVHLLPFVVMILSRVIAFGVLTTVGYGQTIKRSYIYGFKINFIELVITIVLVPLSLAYIHWSVCLLICGALPWTSVLRLYSHSRAIINLRKFESKSNPTTNVF